MGGMFLRSRTDFSGDRLINTLRCALEQGPPAVTFAAIRHSLDRS
jgi:hypothetical protein